MTDIWAAFEQPLAVRWADWFREAALPFWRGHGWSAQTGLAWERLYPNGDADRSAPLRVRTQARQIYTFAHAHLLGFDAGDMSFLARNLERLVACAHAPDGRPGWVHVLDADGQVVDATRDLYDHAFILLMLAYTQTAGIGVRSGAWLEATLAVLDEVFDSDHGGYAENDNGALPRRQNPHMHLFEAMLALFEQTREARFLARADALYDLFRCRFVDTEDGTLREFFTADWRSLPDSQGDVLEPGHHMEWAWLLHRYARLGGAAAAPLASRLFSRGEALGLQAASDGFIVDETDPNGVVLKDSRRLWTQTEYLKALVVQARAYRDPALYQKAQRLTERLLTTYLAAGPSGTWRDRFTVDGRLAVDHVPASTLYHLFGVLVELEHGRREHEHSTANHPASH